jgi:hypothetical protein
MVSVSAYRTRIVVSEGMARLSALFLSTATGEREEEQTGDPSASE